MTKVIYEKHPVSKERKAELRAKGYTIIDAAFKHLYGGTAKVEKDVIDQDQGEQTKDKVDLGTDSGDQFSDAQLRDIIGEVTGTKPSNAAKRENLIKRFNDINAEFAEKTAEAIKNVTE